MWYFDPIGVAIGLNALMLNARGGCHVLSEFLSTLTFLERVFWGMASFGGSIFAISTTVQFLGGGGGDAGGSLAGLLGGGAAPAAAPAAAVTPRPGSRSPDGGRQGGGGGLALLAAPSALPPPA